MKEVKEREGRETDRLKRETDRQTDTQTDRQRQRDEEDILVHPLLPVNIATD